jgi:hypothetical protein
MERKKRRRYKVIQKLMLYLNSTLHYILLSRFIDVVQHFCVARYFVHNSQTLLHNVYLCHLCTVHT